MLRLSLFRLEDTMKRRAFFLTMLMTCLLCGCEQSSASAESAPQREKPEYELSVESILVKRTVPSAATEVAVLCRIMAKRTR